MGVSLYMLNLTIPRTASSHTLQHREQQLSRLPPLEDLLFRWHTRGLSRRDILADLSAREKVLGSATLSGESIRLLYELTSAHIQGLQTLKHLSDWYRRPLYERLVWHAASHSAAETQALLPVGALVQKTVSVAMAGTLLLCTTAGTQNLARDHLRIIAKALVLPRHAARSCTMNPGSCDPVEEFEMLPGMISPFLRPLRRTGLAAVALVPWQQVREEQETEVAVSLSLWESLLLPLRCLRSIVCGYARCAYPTVRLIEIPGEETNDDATCGSPAQS
jgi:hypothetical protein